MTVHLELAAFDGKDTGVLEAIKSNRPWSEALMASLVSLAGDGDEKIQIGATWLLRHYLEEGARLTTEQVVSLGRSLRPMADGFARLHVCQSMGLLSVPTESAPAFADFFRSCTRSRNTFLRAWCLEGFWQLARQHPALEEEVHALLRQGLEDPAASVRARARRTLAGA